jgi:Flp pilus assembly protein TadG
MRSLFRSPKPAKSRLGTTVVEVAVTLPVFGLIMVGLMECGHAMMVVHTLNSAARQAARYGSTEAITTAQTTSRATSIIQNTVGVAPTVLVKDGSIFDTTNVSPESIDYTTLPNIELNTTKSDKLFIVRLSVPYDSAAILPPFWIKGVTLTGQAVMRHE